MSKVQVTAKQVYVSNGGINILSDINFTIAEKQHWVFTGPSGSGKTTLAKALAGKTFFRGSIDFSKKGSARDNVSIIFIEQQHRFKTLSNTTDFYYQQRFNAFDAEDAITVAEYLGDYYDPNHWIEKMQLPSLMQKPLIQLSNGENKRLQITAALLQNPDILVLDSPFTGLDTEGRKTLINIIDTISEQGILIILISNTHEFPTCITHIAELNNGKLEAVTAKEEYLSVNRHPLNTEKIVLPALATEDVLWHNDLPDDIISMKQVTVKYGDKIILDNINWQVKKGECWSISGPNGAGKSTLLSLITADNPQAYANHLFLFCTKRGSGESIWDIKRKIGFVSPELHLYFDQSINCFQVIASGLFDTIGLFRQLSASQEAKVDAWLSLFSLEKLKYKSLQQLSLGQQRKVLLARALVKNPPLLVLDEPCQGLDEEQTSYFSRFVNEIHNQYGTTILYVTHYSGDLPACINHFLRLEEGKLVENR